jgi:hypothetical protein
MIPVSTSVLMVLLKRFGVLSALRIDGEFWPRRRVSAKQRSPKNVRLFYGDLRRNKTD